MLQNKTTAEIDMPCFHQMIHMLKIEKANSRMAPSSMSCFSQKHSLENQMTSRLIHCSLQHSIHAQEPFLLLDAFAPKNWLPVDLQVTNLSDHWLCPCWS